MENIRRNDSLMDDNIFDQEDSILKNGQEIIIEQEKKVSQTSVRNSVSGVKLSPTPSMLIFDVELDNGKPKESSMVADDLKSNRRPIKNRIIKNIGEVSNQFQGRWHRITRWRCFGSLLSLKKISAFVVVMTITLLTGLAIGGLFSMWCALKYNWSSSNSFGHWKHESENKTCTVFEMFAVYWIAFLISTSSLINIYKWWTSYSNSDSSQQERV